jgi:hypothetical protein
VETVCQILFVDRDDIGINLDLISLEDTLVEDQVVPPGAPMTVGFRLSENADPESPAAVALGEVADTLERWTEGCAPVTLEVKDQAESQVVFTNGTERIVLDVHAKPTSWPS